MTSRSARHAALGLGLALSSGWSARAGELELSRGPSFIIAKDAGAVAEAACGPASLAEIVLGDAVLRIHERASVDPEIAIVFASAPLSCSALFYVPVANDVRGIGYQHERPQELFDESPAARLEGVAFLGDYPYWQEHVPEFLSAFAHEVAHRFGARVQARIEGAVSNELLGREEKHWSYFLDSGGSPLEGNRFRTLGPGRYRADTPLGEGVFSDLDLYLMGVLPPEHVAPTRLLRPHPAADVLHDCFGEALRRESVPQWCEALEFTADELSVGIDDVIAVEGERVPQAVDAPRTLDVSIIVLDFGEPWDQPTCEAFDAAVGAAVADFSRASRGRVALRNLTESGQACDAVAPGTTRVAAVAGGGCSLGQGPGSGSGFIALGLLAASMVRARRKNR